MKKISFVLFLTLVMVGTMSATITQCPTSTTLAALIALGQGVENACQSQDKLFYNFSYTPLGDAGNVNATLIFAASATPPIGDLHGWIFTHATGTWTSGFTLSYVIQVAAGNPLVVIATSKDQINSGALPNTVTMVDTQVGNGSPGSQTLNTFGLPLMETVQVPWSGTTMITTTSVF